jgi:tape measure domain-containing protein
VPTEFNLKINADSSGLIKNVGKAVSSIAGLEGASAKTTRGMGKAFGGLAIIASAGLGLDTIQRYGDMLVDTTNRLALLTNSTEEANATMEALFETSKLTRTGFEGTAIVYSRVALALRDANVPMAEMIQFTSTLNKAIILSGTKSVEAGQALIQLSQGMASGALRGDELRSVMEQLPYVADLIADKMGVFRASLRNLGREGKITTTIVRDAIQEATEGVDKAFKKTTVSVSQAGNYLETSFLQSFKKLNEAIPLVKMLSGSLILLADNAGVLGRAIYVMTAALTAMNIYKILIVPIVAATSSIKALGASLHLINIEARANQFGTIGAAIYTSIIAPFAKASKVTAMYGKALDGVKGKLANNAEAIVAAGKTKVLAKRAMENAGSVTVSKGIAPQLRDQYSEMLKRKSTLPNKIASAQSIADAKARGFTKFGTATEGAAVRLAKWKEELAEAEHRLPIITKQLNDAAVMTATYTDRLAKNTGAVNTSTKAYNDAVKAEQDLIAGKAKLEKKIDQTNKKMNESKQSGGPMLLLWTGIKKGIKSVIGALASFASRIGVLVSFGLAGGAVATSIGVVVIVITALVALVFILSSKFKVMSLTMEDGTTKTVSLLDGFIALSKTVWKSFALFKGLSGAITWIKEGFTSLTNNTELWTFLLKTMVNMIMSLVFSFNTLYYSIKVAGLTLIGFFKRDFSGAERAVLDLTGSVDDLKSVLSGDFSKNFLKDLAKEIEKGALETNIDNLTKTMSELRNEVDKVFNVETSFLDKEELELYEFKKTLADLLPKGGLSLEGIIDPKAVELVIADMVKMGVGNDIVYGSLRRLAKQGTVTGKALVDGSAEATFENKKLADSFKEIDAAIKGLNLDPIQDLIDKYKAYTSVKLGLTHGKEFKSPSIGEWLKK